MLKALANVMPRHLLDLRLNPSGELRDSLLGEPRQAASSPALAVRDEHPPVEQLIQIRH